MKPFLLASLLLCRAASAQVVLEVGPDDLNFTEAFPLNLLDLYSASLAYNPLAEEFLAVFCASSDVMGPYWWHGTLIYGQRINAITGLPVGERFYISGLTSANALEPRVAYNPDANEYLAVWRSDAEPNKGFEIFAQRLDGTTCSETGVDDQRISEAGPDGDYGYRAIEPDVVYNPLGQEYLVVWSGEDVDGSPVDGEFEIRAQRLDGSTAAEIGPDDARITHIGPDLDAHWRAGRPRVVHNPDANEYLVTFYATTAYPTPGFNEDWDIYGQRLAGATGEEVGQDDFRISTTGIDGDAMLGASPEVAYSTSSGLYLVAWESTVSAPAATETFGQFLSGATAAELGPDDFQITFTATATSYSSHAGAGAVIANDDAGLFLVVWSTLLYDFHPGNGFEVFVRLVTPASGALLGPGPLQISEAGPSPTGSPEWMLAERPFAAHRAGASSDLVGWFPTLITDASISLGIVLQEVLTCSSEAASSEIVRPGIPPNPPAFQPGATSGPLLGQQWDPFVDHSAFLPDAALDVLAISATTLNVGTDFGTLLVDPSGWPLFLAAASQTFAVPMPQECSLAGVTFYSQAASLTPEGLVGLTNGLDVTLGTF